MRTYFAFGAVEKSSSHQCGIDGGEGDARLDCEDGKLENSDAALYRGRRGVNSAFVYHVGEVSARRPRDLCYMMAAGENRERAAALLETARSIGTRSLIARSVNRWTSLLKRKGRDSRGLIPNLVERSVLALLLLCDKETGGIIASPSTDPDYRYVWPRDAFYVALALDRSGYHSEAERFYLWCTRAQDRSGVLRQRYFSSPELIGPAWGPSWGEEIDETASALWGMVEHLRLTRDRGFLSSVWPFIRGAASYLIGSVDRSGRVRPTMNLWEEKPSRHVYSTATVSAGLKAASEAAKELSHASEARRWGQVSEMVKKNLLEAFWDDRLGHFVRDAEPRDEQVDISSLAISFPFGIIPDHDSRMVRNARALSESFRFRVGGIGRFPSDTNYGGNPWILSTCWLAIHYSNTGHASAARTLLNWSANHATGLALLPEQVDKDHGTVLSAVPLAWSHAMFILASQALSRVL
jgi:oligosaccharide amylase